MYMPYVSNPKLPRVRMDAVKMVRSGKSIRQVAKYYGYNPSTISRWVKKADALGRGQLWIPTDSSRPRSHPAALSAEVVAAIIAERRAHGRCAEIIQQVLLKQGVIVSLSSVKRTLRRHGMLREKSRWKRWHRSVKRPLAVSPGALVQVDTVHFHRAKRPLRFYVYTLLDVYSRWAHAEVRRSLRAVESVRFVHGAQGQAPFAFQMLQSDHGPEFSTYFTRKVGTDHRHSRVRKPNDNAHLERFNRTLKDECFHRRYPDPVRYQQMLDEYLPYYNQERLHLSLNYKTPLECCEGID